LVAVINFSPIFNLEKKVEAALDETELYGYAWSDTIGWISFNNCPTEGSGNCGAIDYSVNVDNNTGLISGHAWSENIGWIKFGGLSGDPLGEEADALLNFDDGAVTGWIRACAGTVNGDCSTMESREDGWDGWIKLSDERYYFSPQTNGEEGVTYDERNQKLVGYAWGGEVVGWIYFYDVSFGSLAEENFDYELSNTSQNYELGIGQGNTGNIIVNRMLLAGTEQESITLSVSSVAGSGIEITINTNNPCNISQFNPDCASLVTIEVGPGVPIGQYQFNIQGVSSPSEIVRTTTVRFRVIEPVPVPAVSCEAQSDLFFLGDTVIWTAEVTNSTGEEEFVWSGGGIDSCVDASCDIAYTTIGPKKPKVSINAGSSFADCTVANVIPRTFELREF